MTAAVEEIALAPWCLFAGEALRSTDMARLVSWLDDLGGCLPPEGAPDTEGWRQALGSDPQALEVEYVRLFLHPNGAACPPWQALYSEEPFLMGRTHREAMAWFQRFSLAPPGEMEPADHAGLLLGFYAFLLNRDEPDNASQFATAHLAWLPAFGNKLAAEAEHPFYQLTGRLVALLGVLACPKALSGS